MRVPTVRVVNPANPASFMTINAADHRAEHHELWPDQAEDFEPADLYRPTAVRTIDPALRDAAAALCLRMVAFRRGAAGEPFAELPTAEQLIILQEMGAELDQAEAAYEDDQRERAAYEAAQREREAPERVQAAAAERDAVASGDKEEPSEAAMRVAKGPGGRWYIYRGEERASKGFSSEAEAAAEMRQVNGAGGA